MSPRQRSTLYKQSHAMPVPTASLVTTEAVEDFKRFQGNFSRAVVSVGVSVGVVVGLSASASGVMRM